MLINRLFTVCTIMTIMIFGLALATQEAAAIVQQKNNAINKRITAFMAPNLDYTKICTIQQVTPVSVNVSNAVLNKEPTRKLRVAVELLNGGPGVFPQPIRAIRMLRELMQQQNSTSARAKLQMARLYLRGQYLPENREKAFELVEEIAPSDPYEAGYFLARLYQHAGQYAKAEELYKRSALVGSPMAYLQLAYLYRDGLVSGIEQSRIDQLVTLAENRALEEIAKGDCRSAHDFGKRFLSDSLNPENHSAGIKWLEASTQTQNRSAISYLGRLYLYGINVAQDVEKGLSYFQKAANLNHGEALYRLGMYWLTKHSQSTENRQKGENYLAKAAEQGYQSALIKLVEYYRGAYNDAPQHEKAVAIMEKAITIPDIPAEIPYMLATAYELGEGTNKDPHKAFQLYELSGKLNYRDALVKIGDAYKYGIGVEQNPMKSYRFYRQAASIGSRDAMLALVENYSCGVGKAPDKRYHEFWKQRAIHAGAGKVLRPEVRRLMHSTEQKDNIAGFMLLKRRIPDGDREAMVMLSHFYANGIGVEKDEKIAQRWIKEAIAEGDGQESGLLALGEAYLDSEIFGIQPKLAEPYLNRAMRLGSDQAGYELGKLYREGAEGFAPDIQKAEEAFRHAVSRGNDNAMRKLSQILFEQKNYDEALTLLEKSTALHNTDSILELVNYHLKLSEQDKTHVKKAAKWLGVANNHYLCSPRMQEKLHRLTAKVNLHDSVVISENINEIIAQAERGNIRAMRKLAQRYMVGFEKTPPNPEVALKWYIEAAKKGDSESMMEIGNAYSTGLGVKPSKKPAREWWERAAKAGNSKAKRMLEVDSSVVENAPAKKPH